MSERFGTNQENQNTKRKTVYDVKLFTSFLKEQGENRDVGELLPHELDHYFGNFIAVLKKPNTTEFEPSSIRGFLSSLER